MNKNMITAFGVVLAESAYGTEIDLSQLQYLRTELANVT